MNQPLFLIYICGSAAECAYDDILSEKSRRLRLADLKFTSGNCEQPHSQRRPTRWCIYVIWIKKNVEFSRGDSFVCIVHRIYTNKYMLARAGEI